VTFLLLKRSAVERHRLALGKPFSFSNQLLHFFACPERKRASLRKIFLIVDYLLCNIRNVCDLFGNEEVFVNRRSGVA
jgi:hypothetical protein